MERPEFNVGDYIESPDYYGQIIHQDNAYVKIKVLLIKDDAAITFEDLRHQGALVNVTDHTDQFLKTSDYFMQLKLLNVPWKEFKKLVGILL